MTACSSHPVPVARAAQLRRWIDSGEYATILAGEYPRRDTDADASVTEEIKAAAALLPGGVQQLHRPARRAAAPPRRRRHRPRGTGRGRGPRGRVPGYRVPPEGTDGPAPAARAHTIAVMTKTMTEAELRAAVEREMPGVRADLERLVRIPGIAFDGLRPLPRRTLRRGRRRTAARLRPGRPDRALRRAARGDRPQAGPARARPPCCSTPTTTCSRSATAPLGVRPVRARRARRPPLRPRRRRRQGRHHGPRRRAARLRRRPPGRRGALHRGRGGVRLRLAGAPPRRAPRRDRRRRHRHRRLRSTGTSACRR